MTGITRDDGRYTDQQIRDIARSIEPHDFDRIRPPETVWNNILAEFEVETLSSEATARRRASSWSRSPTVLAVAAASVLLVGVLALTLGSNRTDPPVQVATAEMTDQDLPVQTTESAQARVVCEDTECSVEVDLTGLPDTGADADLELWVINGDVTDMFTLGNVTETASSFELPAGVTAEEFPIVDISIEPRDGDATHSGQSVLRGVFTQG